MKAEIYTKDFCPYCVKAKQILSNRNIEYKEYLIKTGENEDLEPNQEYVTREDFFERIPNAKTVPQIWLDGEYIGGCTELMKYFGIK